MLTPKKIALFLMDVAVFGLALGTTLFLRYGFSFGERVGAHAGPFLILFFLWAAVFYVNDLYRLKTLKNSRDIFIKLARGVAVSVLISIVIFYAGGGFFGLTPKTNLLIFGAVYLFLGFFFRTFFMKATGRDRAPVGFWGDGNLILEVFEYLKKHPQHGYDPVFIQANPSENRQELLQKIKESGTRTLVVQSNFLKTHGILEFFHGNLPQYFKLMRFTDFYEEVFEKTPVKEIDDDWIIQNVVAYRQYYDEAKRFFEIIFGTFLFVLLLPIMALTTVFVALTSSGPVIYIQKRVGKNGRIFNLYKFRTMYHGSAGPLFTEEGDKRITAAGKILRVSHLDELPQILNIIKGDISFIGPRPERVELAEKYGTLPYYIARHVIKPGITGWAQINYKPSANLEEAYEKLCYDIFYVRNRTAFLDFAILLRTFKHFINF